MPRPLERLRALEMRPDIYDYTPATSLPGTVEWRVNFAGPHLFAAYGTGLFAQDEMQCAEHPALGALREALPAAGLPALTLEQGRPTPVLVTGVECRCHVDTSPDVSADRPYGLYGNEFAAASADAVRRATGRLDPPTPTNIIAMAAPYPGAAAMCPDLQSVTVEGNI